MQKLMTFQPDQVFGLTNVAKKQAYGPEQTEKL